MEEFLEVGQELRLNPYVAQMEKLSESLKYLKNAFKDKVDDRELCDLEAYHVGAISHQVKEKLCGNCDYLQECHMQQDRMLQDIVRELFAEIEEYGIELSISKRRQLEKKCSRFRELQDEVQRNIWIVKSNRMWEARMMQNQDASLVVMKAFVNAIEESTKEIDASMFRDERMERKIVGNLRSKGVRTLKIALFVSASGKYEIHLSAKACAQVYITTNHIAQIISKALGRAIIADRRERLVLKEQYTTMIFVEKPKYQTLCAVVQQKKHGSEVSGDNFLITDMDGGKTCIMLSDGMGSGAGAYRKSKMLLELAEKLLESNIAPRHMIEMINAALVTEVRELEFATLDMCVVDIYSGEVELFKAGASATYIVTPTDCKCFQASSLPMGVIVNSESNQYQYLMTQDCYIVMVSDGVNEALKEEERMHFIRKTIMEAKTQNTKELAAHLLENVLQLQNGSAKDDMLVLVLGVWELQF